MLTSLEAFYWIENIIDSATNEFHIDAIDNIIELFSKHYIDSNLKWLLIKKKNLKLTNIKSCNTNSQNL